MKITLELGQDEELRKEVMRIIREEIKRMSNDEIRKIIIEYVKETDIPAKVVSAAKDFVNKQLDMFMKGYGSMTIRQELDKKIENWLSSNLENYFDKNVRQFVKLYVEDKAQSFKDFISSLGKK